MSHNQFYLEFFKSLICLTDTDQGNKKYKKKSKSQILRDQIDSKFE